MSEQLWDRDLDTSEVYRLSPAAAAERCFTSFTRKVEHLEKLAELPTGHLQVAAKNYMNRTSLRKWNDPELKLWRWSDPLVDKEGGKYPDLHKRWLNVVQILEDQRQGKDFKLRKIIKQKDLIIEAQRQQILDLMEQLREAHSRVLFPVLEQQ